MITNLQFTVLVKMPLNATVLDNIYNVSFMTPRVSISSGDQCRCGYIIASILIICMICTVIIVGIFTAIVKYLETQVADREDIIRMLCVKDITEYDKICTREQLDSSDESIDPSVTIVYDF